MRNDDEGADDRPRSRVTRIFEEMRQGAAAARRQRWTIISAAAVNDSTACDDAGCDCMTVLRYQSSSERQETDG